MFFIRNQEGKFNIEGLTLIPLHQQFNYSREEIDEKRKKKDYWKWAYVPDWYKNYFKNN